MLAKVFTSFDYDNDNDLRVLLIGQALNPDTPFELADWSLKEPLTGDWKAKVRGRIRRVDQLLVLCGAFTNTANGVSVEIEIARQESKPYFLLAGRKDKVCQRPPAALATDKLYTWTWENLKALIGGAR